MIVPNQKVKVKWHPTNIPYYESLGYTYTKIGNEIEIDIKYLPLNSNSEVEIVCDFCGKHHFNQYNRKSKSKNQFCSKECQNNFLIGKESVNKLTFDEVSKIVTKKTKEKCNLINYIEANINMEIGCKCGNSFSVLLGNFKNGKIYCNDCLENIRKQKHFDKMVRFIHSNGNYVLSKCDEYVDNKSLLKILCNCGKVFKTTFKRYKHKSKKQCDDCGFLNQLKAQRLDISKVYDLFKNKGLIPLFYEDDYKNSNTRLPYKCSIHINEEVQYISYASLSRDETIGCSLCRNEKLRGYFKEKNPREYFIEKGLIPLFENEDYINSYQHLSFICKTHESNGVQKNTLTNVKHNLGCKLCCSTKSKGETKIKEYLDQVDLLQYEVEEGFPDCKHKILLKFDFLIYQENKLKLIVEYDGIQHFEPQDFAGKGEEWAIETFKETQIKDNIKSKYCLDKNIPLIRIPYWDFDYIQEILENVLGYLEIIKFDYNESLVFNYLVNNTGLKSVV